MKKQAIFISVLVMALMSGCSSQGKSADAAQSRDVPQEKEKISLDNANFPISIANLLEMFKAYDFYDSLKVVSVNDDQLSSLESSDSTLYLVESPAAGSENADTGQTERSDLLLGKRYHYEGMIIVYNGQDEEIIKALDEKLNERQQ